MKKIFITFMVAVSLLTFNRCTSLDMEPVSSISDANYWKSSDQFKAFNTGLHSFAYVAIIYSYWVNHVPIFMATSLSEVKPLKA